MALAQFPHHGVLLSSSRLVFRRMFASVPSFATLDPDALSGSQPGTAYNLVGGEWTSSASAVPIPDPLTGEPFLTIPNTQRDECAPFIASLKSVPKSGLHNPFKHPDRYVAYGAISARVAAMLREDATAHFFARLIQRVSPKSLPQALGEVVVTRKFFENFSGDQVRFLARSFANPGDHSGQQSSGFRWPFGAVALITPFNFPLEIPALQLMGALYMGNKPLLKVDSKVSIVMDQFLRLLHAAGMPPADADLLHCDGPTMHHLLLQAAPRNTLFTGSSAVAERLAGDLRGRVRVEDAGFDWKVLGPDVAAAEYVAWQADQDAYACSGQKCSAQSILFMHQNWVEAGLEQKLAQRAAQRHLDDLSIGPVLTWTTPQLLEHIAAPLRGHRIPPVYGAIEPTAVFVPLETLLGSEEAFRLATTEVFGPFQILTAYTSAQLPAVLEALERMHAHLTAAVVSNDALFLQEVLGSTVNGTTYAGIRARTTGAPQNHWFGPCGDPRGAGIGTREAIQLVWSSHREIIHDVGPVAEHWTAPPPT
ncbi:delta-1-pyrroline-5-carboxylate dehydrogenase 1 protein [Klebsormidium nitens]|uniref:Delta-1-pyrroline-5-carboxylate dehydrogenase 1 protein n=1 Tax=Klebsormidium nitens TaxID=105231 RepID=A0A1Y1IDJ6_KLENI|nr:delta-1-pyrroline-5-carboxylate dehydrogenase 1 protein [Klebsormidium nitens]|eukprot:GAQ87509.1 delta-1-pyrroline-5-carboxylate dehydrogenase 1 protein [Klebsormidium nitens]